MAVELLVGEPTQGESAKSILACNDYLRMGPGRSLSKLCDRYQTVTKPLPPTKRLPTLKEWSVNFDWQERAALYDAQVEQEKNALLEQRRREVMEEGLALDYERVLKLKRLADLLEEFVYQEARPAVTSDEQGEKVAEPEEVNATGAGRLIDELQARYPSLWLPDAKSIGAGLNAERIDLVRFNPALLDQYRGVLDDIAKETGGRKQKMDVAHSGKIDLTKLSDDELDQLAEQLNPGR